MPGMNSSVKMNGLTNAQQESLERLWEQLVCLMQRDHVSEVDMPMNIKNMLGKNGLNILVSRFSEFITAKVAMTEDIANSTIHMKPTFESWGLTVIPNPEAKAPRPPNAFILYRQHWHPYVKVAHPELHNTQISSILGKQWNNEDDATKAEWRLKADEFKKQHAITYPKYQYQPRKPNEKKRRLTRRKSGALSENGSTSSAAIVPDFETNNAGNLVITLDDNDLDDATFEAIHHNYNMSLPANTPAASTLRSVVFTGHSKESQEGWAINQSQIDCIVNNSPTDADVDAEFARVFQGVNTLDESWGMMDPNEQAFHWDRFHDKASQKDLGRFNFVSDA